MPNTSNSSLRPTLPNVFESIKKYLRIRGALVQYERDAKTAAESIAAYLVLMRFHFIRCFSIGRGTGSVFETYVIKEGDKNEIEIKDKNDTPGPIQKQIEPILIVYVYPALAKKYGFDYPDGIRWNATFKLSTKKDSITVLLFAHRILGDKDAIERTIEIDRNFYAWMRRILRGLFSRE